MRAVATPVIQVQMWGVLWTGWTLAALGPDAVEAFGEATFGFEGFG